MNPKQFAELFALVRDWNAIIPKIADDRTQRPRIEVDEDTGQLKKILINQSMLKRFFFRFERREVCPRKEYHISILRDLRAPQTESMLYGKYAETKVLGKGAGGEQVFDLPRNKRTGEKRTAHIRIDEAIQRFWHVIKDYGIIVIPEDLPGQRSNTQISFDIPIEIEEYADSGIKIYVTMDLDLLSPITFGGVDYNMAVIDFKLTQDRDATYGAYSWGSPEYMDHTQAYMYGFFMTMPFFYFVLDYREVDPGYKIIPVNTNLNHLVEERRMEAQTRYQELMEVLRKMIEIIIIHHQQGWHTEPSYANCKDCPVLNCPDRNKNQEI